MPSTEIVVIVAVGIVAGMANVLAGAGSLLTYPVLVAFGVPPLAANVTNDLGVLPGNVSGVVGMRASLRGQGPLVRVLVARAVIGSLIGASLLLVAPAAAFAWVAPPLLLLASALTLAQPALARRWAAHQNERKRALHAAIDAVSVYGGYFGTGIGLLFMATLGVFRDESPAQLNGLKTVLQLVCNGLPGIVFALVAPVRWPLAAALAGGTMLGGPVGARLVRVIPAAGFRGVVAGIGLAASVALLAEQLAR